MAATACAPAAHRVAIVVPSSTTSSSTSTTMTAVAPPTTTTTIQPSSPGRHPTSRPVIVARTAAPAGSCWASIRRRESGGNYSTNTGNGYYGAYQFDLQTWRGVGGTGLPSNASPAEQDRRALMLYKLRRWAPWGGCPR